jgi:hypothetical protein
MISLSANALGMTTFLLVGMVGDLLQNHQKSAKSMSKSSMLNISSNMGGFQLFVSWPARCLMKLPIGLSKDPNRVDGSAWIYPTETQPPRCSMPPLHLSV